MLLTGVKILKVISKKQKAVNVYPLRSMLVHSVNFYRCSGACLSAESRDAKDAVNWDIEDIEEWRVREGVLSPVN